MTMGPNINARDEIKENYSETLSDLQDTNKYRIDLLTELAWEYREHASVVVECIEEQVDKVEGPIQLPLLYLIDSIIKQDKTQAIYKPLFSKNISALFTKVYKQNDEHIRRKLHKLREVWSGSFPRESLEALDNSVRVMNPAWSVANPIHVNPKFVQSVTAVSPIISQLAQQRTTNEVSKQSKHQALGKQLQALELKRTKTAERIFVSASKVISQFELLRSTRSSSLDLEEIKRVHGNVKNIEKSLDSFLEHEPNKLQFSVLVKDYEGFRSKLSEIVNVLEELAKEPTVRHTATNKSQSLTSLSVDTSSTQTAAPTIVTSPLFNSKSQTRSLPNNCHTLLNKANGVLSNAQAPQAKPTFRIAPVSSELINAAAAKRARDPRLRRLDQEPTKVNNEAVNGKNIKTATTSHQIESKNEKQNESPERSKSTEGKKSELELKLKPKNNYANSAAAIEELFEDTSSSNKKQEKGRNPVKKLSREERSKRLRILKEANKAGPVLEELSKNDPKAAETLSRYINRGNEGKKKCKEPDSDSMDTDDANDCVFVSTFKVDELDQDEAKSKPVPEIIDSLEIEDKDSEEYDPTMVMMSSKPVDSDFYLPDDCVTDSLDLSTLLPPTLPNSSLSMAVNETAGNAVTTSGDSASFGNPFGLNETKDVDYRQLFRSLAPTLVSSASIVESKDIKTTTTISSSSELISTSSVNESIEEKSVVKRKHDEEIVERNKRQRTLSPTNSDQDSREKFDENEKSYPKTDCDDVEMLDASNGTKGYSADHMSPSTPIYEDSDSNLVIMPTTQPRAASKSPPLVNPFFEHNIPAFDSPNFGGLFPSACPEVPPANPDVLKMIDRDPMKTIPVDGFPREIRHYGSTAVIFIHWDDMRQVLFKPEPVPRKIIIDDKICVPCWLNSPDVEALIHDQPHRFRFGVPTRELYIDGIGYQCYFGGDPIQVKFDGVMRSVRIVGQPPKVDISPTKRPDLVAGKINMIINDEYTFPVFLDAKAQKIVVDNVTFVIMFIDALKRVCINDTPFRTEFGGLPQSFKFNKKVYYFRFTPLPMGIVPGAINIYQMVMTKLPSPPPLPPSLQYSAVSGTADDFQMLPVATAIPPITNVPNMLVNTLPVSRDADFAGSTSNTSDTNIPSSSVSNLLGSLNIDALLQSLVDSGVVSTEKEEKVKEVQDETIKYVDFKKSETFKQKQPGMISLLHSGTQCGSCGLRFPEEQTLKYSEHLDWHFRLNRRGKNGAKTIHSRKWYYNSADWMQFQEMEDKSDRGQSWFENHLETEYTEEEVEDVPCVSASQNSHEVCVLCQDKFEQFYSEEIDEWQLRNAVRIDDKLYHPICHQDHNEKSYQSDDIEEIVDLVEPINVDDTPSCEDNNLNSLEHELDSLSNVLGHSDIVDGADSVPVETLIKIKQEKPDVPKMNSEKPADTSSNGIQDTGETENYTYDSDIEDVQVIEQPIEEIIIPDDTNDLDDPNLETLNVEEIISAPKEAETTTEKPAVEPIEKIVDITQPTNVVSIDGNIELAETYQQLVSGPTKIKINIAKTHYEDKIASPKAFLDEANEIEERKILDEPPPPGEEVISLVSANVKPRLKNCNLKVNREPVKKGEELGSICSIM